MQIMGEVDVYVPQEWRYLAVLLALVAGALLQGAMLPCLCYAGTVRMQVAIAVDAIVLVRLAFARIFREHNRGWVFYAMLPSLIVPVILAAEQIWWPNS